MQTNQSKSQPSVSTSGRYQKSFVMLLACATAFAPAAAGIVLSGTANTAPDANSVVSGGQNNDIALGAALSGIGSGSGNDITNAFSDFSFIGGGANNLINSANSAAMAGGSSNSIENAYYSFIGGGFANSLTSISPYGSVVGGNDNDIASSPSAFVGGGNDNNIASSARSFIGGGTLNDISSASDSVVVGGNNNNIAGASSYSFIGGGLGNDVPDNAPYSVVAGGESNDVAGSNSHATIGGGMGNVARAPFSAITGGAFAQTRSFGEWAHASGKFGGMAGSAQASTFVARAETFGDGTAELYLDGTAAEMLVPQAGAWTFKGTVVALANNGKTSAWTFEGCISKLLSTTMPCPLVKTPLGGNPGPPLLDIQVSADDTTGSLEVEGVANLATSSYILWVARVDTVQVILGL